MSPKADPKNSDRKLFATKAADGSIEYFPKKNQATAQELAEGRYLEGFAAKDPMNTIQEASKYKRPTVTEASTGRTLFATTTTNWLGRSKTEYLPRQSEATEQELLTGEQAPQLVLRSAQFVSDVARETPELQQQFSEGG